VIQRTDSLDLLLGREEEAMKKAMATTQWVLGIVASLSLLISIVYKFVYMFSQALLPYTSPMGFLWLAASCAMVSIALSLIKIGKIMEQDKK